MKLFITTILLTALGTQAVALSCLRPDPIETFQRLAAAPESYFVIYGTLTFDETDSPRIIDPSGMAPDPDPIPGWFEGKGLSAEGFVKPYVGRVQLQVTCAGQWCGSARSGGVALYFVPNSDPPVSLIAEPCGGMIFADPAPQVLDMLTSCMQGNTCTPVPFEE